MNNIRNEEELLERFFGSHHEHIADNIQQAANINSVFSHTHIRKILSLLLLFFSSISSAQEPEETLNSGYIDVSNGLMVSQQTFRHVESVKDGIIKYYSSTYVEHSLYALDKYGKPATLLAANVIDDYEFRILPGTTRIAKGAFKRSLIKTNAGSHRQTPGVLIIPSSLKFIPEDLFETSTVPNIFIDDSEPTAINEVKQDANQKNEEAKEVARYNVQGQKVNEKAKGIQIIQYDNGSSKKVAKK